MLERHKNPNGTYDGAAVLSELSGLPKSEMLSMFEEVKRNHARLDACPAHEFELIPQEGLGARMRDRYRCTVCGGDVSSEAYRWHEIGRGKRPP